jgi:biopolymer transport protein TolQ
MPAPATTGLAISLGIVSKLVLFVLIAFSVVAWAIVFLKWRAFRSADEEDRRFLHVYGRSPDSHDLMKLAKRAPHSPSGAIYLGLMERVGREGDRDVGAFSTGTLDDSEEAQVPDRRYLEQVASKILQSHLSRLEDWLPFLATTGNVTPFIGLLGTVMGIIDAFREIGRQGTASLAAVAPGVAEALVATAAGLFTAIPAVIAYNYFLMRIRKIAFRSDSFVVELVQSLRSKPRQVGVRG